jgi:hypothetical protein
VKDPRGCESLGSKRIGAGEEEKGKRSKKRGAEKGMRFIF